MLTGGGKGSVGGSNNSGTGGTKSSSTGGYKPPHRRESSYSSSSYGKSTNWEDFMPNYDEEDTKYDSDGDSFGSIFSDIVTGAAGYAAGVAGSGSGGGIVGDFVEFLERNVDGFESGYDDDKSLSQLLTYGSFDEVASEMDETDVLVTSLETKLSTVENELIQAQADLNVAVKFSEKLDLEERGAELKAREKVVKGYVKKCKKRLIRLRERYKELMVEGRGGRGYGGRSSSSGDSASGARSNSSGSSSRSSSYNRAPQSAPPASSTASTPTSAPASAPASSSSKSWRDEGFKSSYGRRSSGSRRSSSRRSRETTNANEPAAAKEQQSSQQQQRSANENVSSSSSGRSSSSRSGGGNASSSSTAGANGSKSAISQQYEPWVPPHRRTQSTAERDAQDKKKLRELRVDDDFEKLKREMGM